MISAINRPVYFQEGSAAVGCLQKLKDLATAIKNAVIQFFQSLCSCLFKSTKPLSEQRVTALPIEKPLVLEVSVEQREATPTPVDEIAAEKTKPSPTPSASEDGSSSFQNPLSSDGTGVLIPSDPDSRSVHSEVQNLPLDEDIDLHDPVLCLQTSQSNTHASIAERIKCSGSVAKSAEDIDRFISRVLGMPLLERRHRLNKEYPLKCIRTLQGHSYLPDLGAAIFYVLEGLTTAWWDDRAKDIHAIEENGNSQYSQKRGLPSLEDKIQDYQLLRITNTDLNAQFPRFRTLEEPIVKSNINQLIEQLDSDAQTTSPFKVVLLETDMSQTERTYGLIVRFNPDKKEYDYYFLDPYGKENGPFSVTVYDKKNLEYYLCECYYSVIPVEDVVQVL